VTRVTFVIIPEPLCIEMVIIFIYECVLLNEVTKTGK